MKKIKCTVILLAALMIGCGNAESADSKTAEASETVTVHEDAEDQTNALGSLDIPIAELNSRIDQMASENSLPDHPYAINITDASTEITLEFSGETFLCAISAHGQRIDLDESINLYGNCTFHLFEYSGAVILDRLFYDIGSTLVLTEDGTDYLTPEEDMSVKLFIGDDGTLRWQKMRCDVYRISQEGILRYARSRDDFFAEYGSAEIVNGRIVLHEADEKYTVSDIYDLDEEFEKHGDAYSEMGELEDLFEYNQSRNTIQKISSVWYYLN